MLKRKAYKELLNWKNNHSKTCLMVKGARQVGKTYLIREFGKAEYESFIEINFIKNKNLKNIFNGDLSANNIYKRMTSHIDSINLIEGRTLIFLDEIQVCGAARTAIKFLAEDGRYDVISSGSLLGLSYGEEGDDEVEEPESVPTGYEDFITMYSLDFEEFLWANGIDNQAIKILKDYFDNNLPIEKDIVEKYEELFREFIVVGGMPEVVDDFITNKDFNRVSLIQNRILENYRFDIAKHAKGSEKIKVRNCYDSIPKQLAKELKKFKYSLVEKGQTSKKYGGSIKWLEDSATVNICTNVKKPNIPLMAYSIDEQFKMYINDTGLLCAMYGFETKMAILDNKLIGPIKGGIYENVIAESLIKRGYKIYYYKPNDEQEIEFLIEKNADVVPIEVKAGNSHTTSLNLYLKEMSPKIGYKLVNGGIGIIENKKTIPHFMIIFI